MTRIRPEGEVRRNYFHCCELVSFSAFFFIRVIRVIRGYPWCLRGWVSQTCGRGCLRGGGLRLERVMLLWRVESG